MQLLARVLLRAETPHLPPSHCRAFTTKQMNAGALAGLEGDPALVQVLVRKMRNKAAGRIGDGLLRYDRATGTYADEGGGAHEAAR